MTYDFTLKSLQETHALATFMAELAEPMDVILLQGPLGSGKTEWARAFIQSFMGMDVTVPSPTFTLVQPYQTDYVDIWHFDLYRLENSEEVWELGLEEAIIDGIVLIEWPERLPPYFRPPHQVRLTFDTPKKGTHRSVTIEGDDHWMARLQDAF